MSKDFLVIRKHIQTTWGKGYVLPLGFFCGFIRLKDVLGKYKKPILCATVDGVGTKTIEADLMADWKVIGEDLVNHNAIDIAVHGAKAIGFLDYIAGSHNIPGRILEPLMEGMASASRQIGCEILGGETADFMMGIYQDDRYDVVGFMFGVAEEDRLIYGKEIIEGDVIIGVASNGLHTNGYSLAREKLFGQKDKKEIMEMLTKDYPELGCTLGEALTKPHYPYYSYIHGLINSGIKIYGLAHITGGGLAGNIIRILPEYMEAIINVDSWPQPPIFSLIQKAGNLNEDQMREAFNLGIGLVCIVVQPEAEKVIKFFQNHNIPAYKIGVTRHAVRRAVKFIEKQGNSSS